MLVAWALALLVTDGLDYRSAQSPVKDQNPRGTCAAFAVAAAIEALPGTAADVSEQFLYAIVKKRQLDLERFRKAFPAWAPFLREGDPLSEYAALFTLVGAPPERVLPYQNGRVLVPPGTPDLAKFLGLAQIDPADLEKLRDAWGKYGIAADGVRVLEGDEARDVGKIKALLASGILAVPVGYTIYPPAWSLQDPKTNDPRKPRFTPDHMEQFKRGLDLEWMSWAEATRLAPGVDLARALGPLVHRLGAKADGAGKPPTAWTARLREPVLDAQGNLVYGGHAMTIVGYTADSFILKNSWGPAWGDGGYAEVSFDYHRLYAIGALEVRAASVRLPALSPFERKARLASAEIHLKVQPVRTALWEEWRISTYTLGMRDPPVDAVEYEVQGQDAGGPWTSRARYREVPKDASAPRGFPHTIAGIELINLRDKATRMRIIARFGFDVGADGQPLEWAATRTFGPFDAQPRVMQVLPGS